MKLELFNKTLRTKELPKYNYKGKFKLGPQETYPIEDYMRTFYQPYNRIGVIVRRAENDTNTEVEVEKEVQEILNTEEPEKKEEAVQEVEQEVTEEKESVEVVDEEETKQYTASELNEMKMNDLKDLLAKMGLPAPSKYNKKSYVKAVLDSYKK